MIRQSFIYGALILLLANFLNRIVGFAYQILMMRLIGPEGVGLFNMIYPIYVLVLVAATAGIPLAIAKLVAEETAKNNLPGAYRIFKIALLFISALSIFFALVLFFSAPYLKEHIFPNPKVYYSFLCLTPGILVAPLCSAFRGFFQGLQQMVPTAVTQITEQSIRVVAGLSIAYFLLPHGVEYAAIGISLGVILGEFTGFLLMLGIYFFRRPRIFSPKTPGYPLKMIITRIFIIAIPVTLTRLVTSGVMSVDAILIPYRLHASGLSMPAATAVYGELIGIAMALVLTPGIITFALSTALVPAISDAIAVDNFSLVRNRIGEAIRITMLAGIPAMVILFAIPEELCDLFFNYPQAAHILSALTLGAPFLYLSQTQTGILYGMGRADKPLKNLIAGSIVKITGIYYLTVIPSLGITGTAYAFSISYVIIAYLNYRDLSSLTGLKAEFNQWFLKPFLASIIMILVIINLHSGLGGLIASEKLRTIISLVLGMPVYIIIMSFIGGIKSQDVQRFKEIFK